jgi:isopenicillin-N N-acyltransferase like protein
MLTFVANSLRKAILNQSMFYKKKYAKAIRHFTHTASNLQHAIYNLHFANIYFLLFISALLLSPCLSIAAEERVFQEGRFEGGQLRYINDLPVLMVTGTPQEIGRQKAALIGDVVLKLADYPKQLLRVADDSDERWHKLVEMSEALKPQIPADYRDEMRAFAEKPGFERLQEYGVLGNVMVDIYRGGFGCSSIIAEASRSSTGGPLFGRNLDFYTLGILDKYGLVTVHRPKGKHAFVSIGFPGIFGCISGMNDAGLALAVHEVFLSRDRAPMFNPKGMPYTMCFRRMLEECSSVEEAEKLLRKTERTTLLSLAVCDRRQAAVFEMTPKTVAVRYADDGLCFCTNHFRTDELIMFAWCRRYPILEKAQSIKTLDVEDVAKKLDDVNAGRMTVQSMIFEPEPLILHLAMGSCPSSALPMKKLELQPLFKP